MALMAGGAAVENKGELSVCMLSDFPEYLGPPPQSVADIERFQYETAWHEEIKNELGGKKKTTGTYEAATPPQGRKPVGAKWVFTY